MTGIFCFFVVLGFLLFLSCQKWNNMLRGGSPEKMRVREIEKKQQQALKTIYRKCDLDYDTKSGVPYNKEGKAVRYDKISKAFISYIDQTKFVRKSKPP